MKGSHCLAVPLLLAGSMAAAQEVKLQPTGLQDATFGTAVIEQDDNSITIIARPSVDTSNRPQCRRVVDNQRVNNGIRCYFVDTGATDPGCRINLTPQLGDNNGGHEHDTNRLLGTVTPSTGLGQYNFVYNAPEVSGQVNIIATGVDSYGNSIRPFTFHINVETQGLVELPPSNDYRFVGAPGSHSQRFWGTPELIQGLIGLAADYHAAFPEHTLGYNDMNLPKGGLFDLRNDWSEPHCGHRGNSADLRTNDIPAARRARVIQQIADNGLGLYDETDTVAPHYHLSR